MTMLVIASRFGFTPRRPVADLCNGPGLADILACASDECCRGA